MNTFLRTPFAAACLIACSVFASAANATDYKISSGPDLGIRQIFEEGQTIVIQFENAPAPGSVSAKTVSGEDIPVRALGRFTVVTKTAPDFTVQVGNGNDRNRIVSAEIFRQELAAKRAKDEADRKAREEAARQAKLEAERLAREEAARTAALAAEQAAQSKSIPDDTAKTRAEYAAELAKASSGAVPRCEATQKWAAKSGQTLRDAVEGWTTKEGWTLVWDTTVDYPISAPIAFEGCFADAVISLFGAYDKAEKPLVVDGHVNQKTLVVTARK